MGKYKDPCRPPFDLKENSTSEERREWLDWYMNSMDARRKQRDSFSTAAAVWLGLAFLAFPAMIFVVMIVQTLFGK